MLKFYLHLKARPRGSGYDDHSDESETSSVCSERSMDSVNRRSDVINHTQYILFRID